MKFYFWLILVFLSVVFLQCSSNSQAERLVNGVAMPNIEGVDSEGNKISLASIENKIVLVDFWASWCKPCIEAFPKMEKMYQEFKDVKIGEAEGFDWICRGDE